MPDIDIDFCYERRQEVIDYVVRKYGEERVVQIITFGTMAAKGVIRDVGRALDLPYARCDMVAKMIPGDLGMTIDKALRMNPQLRQLYENDEEIHYLIDMSKRLEGLPRHTSMHAAGVVISPKSVDEYVPLSRAADDSITTQFTMTTLEELGLLKMDFLGLRTLTVINNAVKLVNRGKKENFLDIDRIDYNDKKVFELISSGKTDGIFQLESAGMKSFMKELKPENIEDIIAGISLYRPGPMDFIPKYIKGKNDKSSITYDCDELKDILAPTYGCIVYQEQVMQIVMQLAGYDLGRSDLVRRAMSKKKADVMAKEREYFVYGNKEMNVPGCIANGIDEKTANKIFDEMTDFAKYAFNKSHAAAYTIVSYQTAYLKCYYPVEFMAAIMTSVVDNPSKMVEYIMACRQMNIKILPPDINEGESGFSVIDGNIRYGLSAIKSLGKPVIEAIIEERNLNGPFISLKDFAARLSGKEVNKRTIESFIKAGTFDSFGVNRRQLMLVYMKILDQVNQEKKKTMTGQMSLFDFVDEDQKSEFDIKYPDVEEYDKETKLAFEKEVLGVYLSGHPLDEYAEQWKKHITATTRDFEFDEETQSTGVTDGEEKTIGGLIQSKTIKTTKNNKVMAFISVEDLYGVVEVLIFPNVYERCQEFLLEDSKVFVTGRVSVSDEQPAKLICEKLIPFSKVPKEVWIKFRDMDEYHEKMKILYKMIEDEDGDDRIVIFCAKEKAIKRLPLINNIQVNQDIIGSLSREFGSENVKVAESVLKTR